jgi:hypothetical protein
MFQDIHGMSREKIYKKWTAMVSRCSNPNDPNYKNYGARGITISKEWLVFESFFLDMGDIPFDNAQIDRIDNTSEYSKNNCKWSSPKENSRNRRTTKKHLTHLGSLVQQELIEKIGWTKDQFRWFYKKNGISWILEGFKNGTLPIKINMTIDRSDIENSQVGQWKVLEFKVYSKKTGHLYLCRCSCGTEKLIHRNNLIKSKTTSCRSCSAKKKWIERLAQP